MGYRSKDFVESSVNVLKSISDAEVLEYPNSQSQRTIDVAIRVVGKGSVIVKVARDAAEVGKSEREELKRISAAVGVNAFIVAETKYGQGLIEGVIYDVEGVKVVNINTIINAIQGEDYPVIFEDKDGFKIKIDGELLRTLRLKKGYSLGQAAERLKVSRKTVYDYERGAVKPTIDVAERIIKEFGEDIAKPIDIFNNQDDVLTTRVSNLEGSPADSSFEGMIVERLRTLGWKFTHAKRAPLDIAASKNNVKVLLTIPHPNEARKLMTNRAENMVKLAKALMCDSYLVVDRSQKAEAKRVLGEPEKVLTVDELSDLLGDELDLKAASNYREARRW
ncbi:MAG: helix-turn-helix domain-containing protein [Acidilobus sp.]